MGGVSALPLGSGPGLLSRSLQDQFIPLQPRRAEALSSGRRQICQRRAYLQDVDVTVGVSHKRLRLPDRHGLVETVALKGRSGSEGRGTGGATPGVVLTVTMMMLVSVMTFFWSLSKVGSGW